MNNETYKILLVDDEPDILEFLSYNLRKEGFKVFTAKNGEIGIKKAIEKKPHLIILDVMMPGMDGMETCRQIRASSEVPADTSITFLTARGEDYSQIAGFEAGADDYITKPIRPKLFISRIKALLNRYKKTSKLIVRGELIIDTEKYYATYKNEKLILPKKEFALLKLLVSEKDKVFTRSEIYDKVWGEDIIVGERTIDVHIRNLRKKISQESIVTIKGVGYKYCEI